MTRNLKRVLALLLAVMMLVGTVATVYADDDDGLITVHTNGNTNLSAEDQNKDISVNADGITFAQLAGFPSARADTNKVFIDWRAKGEGETNKTAPVIYPKDVLEEGDELVPNTKGSDEVQKITFRHFFDIDNKSVVDSWSFYLMAEGKEGDYDNSNAWTKKIPAHITADGAVWHYSTDGYIDNDTFVKAGYVSQNYIPEDGSEAVFTMEWQVAFDWGDLKDKAPGTEPSCYTDGWKVVVNKLPDLAELEEGYVWSSTANYYTAITEEYKSQPMVYAVPEDAESDPSGEPSDEPGEGRKVPNALLLYNWEDAKCEEPPAGQSATANADVFFSVADQAKVDFLPNYAELTDDASDAVEGYEITGWDVYISDSGADDEKIDTITSGKDSIVDKPDYQGKEVILEAVWGETEHQGDDDETTVEVKLYYAWPDVEGYEHDQDKEDGTITTGTFWVDEEADFLPFDEINPTVEVPGHKFAGWTVKIGAFPFEMLIEEDGAKGIPFSYYKENVLDAGLSVEISATAIWLEYYTATFVGGDYDDFTSNVAPPPQSQLAGKEITLPENTFERTGQTFDGWKTDGDVDPRAEGSTYEMPDHDVVFEAQWKPAEGPEPQTYTVKYNFAGGESETLVADTPYTKTVGEEFRLPDVGVVVREGYKLVAWIADDTDGTSYQPDEVYTKEVDVTFTAKWVKLYTVTYKFDEGESQKPEELEENKPYEYEENEPITLPDENKVKREGYTLIGWEEDNETKTVHYVADLSYTVTRDATFTALWNKNGVVEDPKPYREVTAEVDYNDHTPEGARFETQVRFYIDDDSEPFLVEWETLLGWVNSVEDYKFTGWLLKIGEDYSDEIGDGSGPYQDSDSYKGEDVKLVAQWEPVKYAVTYKKNAPDDEITDRWPSNESYAAGETFDLPEETFARDGYKFTGWESSEDNKVYKAGYEDYVMPKGGVTFTAQWEKNQPKEHKLTYDSNGGKGSIDPEYHLAEEKFPLSNGNGFSRNGYNFTGWIYGTEILAPGAEFTMPDDDVTLYANWVKKPNYGGGSGGNDTVYPVDNNTGSGSGGSWSTDKSNARKGETVTVTPKAGDGYISTKPTVTDQDGNPVNVIDNGDGTYSFLMPEGGAIVTGNYVTPSQMFSDVPNSPWYQTEVAYVVENGLMNGSGGMFMPETDLSRGMLVTILYRLEGSPAASSSTNFSDVPANEWYAKAVAWANANGIVEGSDGRYYPDAAVSREQFATIMYRYARYKGLSTSGRNDLAGYTDVSAINDWALDGMQWANAAGLITGAAGGTTLVPGANSSRAVAATILMRFCKGYELL